MQDIHEDYDVVVAGGGLAGFSAAVASARHGAKTVLIQDRPVLGGNSSSEIRVTPHGAAAFHAYARESGIVSEALVEERSKNHERITENGWTNSVWDLVLYDMAMRTENLTLHVNTVVESLQTDGTRITSLSARGLNAETMLTVTGRTFIDCTGDGTLAALAGCTWRSGTEGKAEFDELHAPGDASDGVMGSSLHFKTVDTGAPAPFTAPDWAVSYDDPDFFYKGGRVPKRYSSGYWWIEIGPPWDTLHDNEKIRHELTRHLLGIWDFFKNKDPKSKAQTANLALDWVGQVPGKRENRRLTGKRLLTENDLIERTVFDDEVAFGGWYVDLHTIGGLLAETSEPLNARDLDPTSDYGAKTNVGPFGIPLASMVSAEVPNLLFAGRNVSATHAALGSIRVMSTSAIMGQAVGTVAAMSQGSELAGYIESRLSDVQQTLLRDGCFLPNVRNRDEQDLALRASISASSSQPVQGIGTQSVDHLGGLDHWRDHPVYPQYGELQQRTVQWIALDERGQLDRVYVCLRNTTGRPVEVEASLAKVEDIWDYRILDETLATTTLVVPPGGPHWVEWQVGLNDRSVGDGYVRLDLEKTEGAEWVVASTILPGQLAGYEAAPGLLRRFGGGSTMSFQIDPPQSPYKARNVLTGTTRPHRSTNVWRSDPGRPLPQWIELAWDAPVEVRQLQVTFAGHLLREYHAYPPFYRDPQCAKTYAIEVPEGEGWRPIIEVDGNYRTRVVHTLDEPVLTDRVRLVVSATNGDASAAVYEMRAYSAPLCTPMG
ncbi:hypothetical protein C5B85_15640 [Pseudoclavibacter sp. AY1F1]|uniref:FAD-dependent oxidoreductase n=1 Tax=Pseudoclavibacter sp. AY1F1 TaxID=2080583 RepID=UPI000CE8BDF9|nr:FAD-dependent oxidoreductase [Pseudoclavibacter sp. AY1F1]PPF42704.1 hypothetical protein C5B85_15640 [Pseudoclavibacter sp. AY1F1]